MNISKDKHKKKYAKKSYDVTFDKEESDESKHFWDDCSRDVSKGKNKNLNSSVNSRNQKLSSSLPKNSAHFSSKGSNGRKTSAPKNERYSVNYKHSVESQYCKTIQTIDPKDYREMISPLTTLTDRDKSFDKLSNGKTLNTLDSERTSSCVREGNKLTKMFKRINQLYLHSNQRKEKINLLKEEQIHKQSEKEMEECTFKPKVNSNAKNVKEGADFLRRNQKWQNEVTNKLEKIKNKVEVETTFDFKPKITKKNPNFDTNKHASVKDKGTLKYFERINNAKKQKEYLLKKLNPDYNQMYDKLYNKKQQDTSDDYATFNPNKTKHINMNSVRQTLHNELNSLTIDQETI